MFKKLLLYIYILISITIFSIDNLDYVISRNLLDIYGDNITLKQLENVLEFDKNNSRALIKKSELLDNNEIDLNIPKKLLEKTELLDLNSRYHYISILYRLHHYQELINHIVDLKFYSITDPDIIYYISDSYYRLNNLDKLNEMLGIALHQYPMDIRFYELLYLVNNKREVLTSILNLDNSLDSLIRLYNRVDKKLNLITLEVLILEKIKNITDIDNIKYNYSVIPILENNEKYKNIDGTFFVDSNSDTFIDTTFTLKNGEILYKSIDWDGDNIKDFECYLEDSKPKKINFKESYIYYDNYPYIDYIFVNGEEDIIYNLYKKYTKFIIPYLIKQKNIYPDYMLLEKIKLNSKLIYKNEILISKWEYKHEDTIYIYSEPNAIGTFDRLDVIHNNLKELNLRDLNSDGINDYLELFNNGDYISSEFSEFGNQNWMIK